MAVEGRIYEPVTEFSQWYTEYEIDERDGCLETRRGLAPCADKLWHRFQVYKREMDARVENYWKLDLLADNEVLSKKPDLPNVSSGETAGLVRRVARNLVQNAPNVEVISLFDDDSVEGIFAKHVLTSKIIGSDHYSNDMQQNLFASTKSSFARGFDAVIPVLLEDAAKGWYVKYDTIHYRDVFPEPGAKDVRTANDVFIRRYLTEADVHALLRNNTAGWDHAALRTIAKNRPPARERQSTDRQQAKHGIIPDGYEIITWYSSTGDHFLTFEATSRLLLRIEKNKHPLKLHPVFFLVLEKDDQQPLGKSQVELLIGRQEFQDLMLNGAMKLWYRNINPSILGFGAANATPNLSPGKYTQISNPNARIEPFEVNTQTLMQYGSISEQNLGSMVNLVGAADQQMATQAGNGMSATPQGVEAQQAMVDITTNNYQKAIEGFVSHYCSYALTMFFAELKTVKSVTVTAEARRKLLAAGLEPEHFNADGTLSIDFERLAVEYFVRCVPGSLVELEDEKQLRLLNQLFVPLSQAMPAMAASQDQEMLQAAARAMQYIIGKQIELSGAQDAKSIVGIWKGDDIEQINERDRRIAELEEKMGGVEAQAEVELDLNTQAVQQLQQQVSMLTQNMQLFLEKSGIHSPASETGSPTPAGPAGTEVENSPTVTPVNA